MWYRIAVLGHSVLRTAHCPASLAGCVVPLRGSYTACGTRDVCPARGTKVMLSRCQVYPTVRTRKQKHTMACHQRAYCSGIPLEYNAE
jgi:hypothetical protein